MKLLFVRAFNNGWARLDESEGRFVNINEPIPNANKRAFARATTFVPLSQGRIVPIPRALSLLFPMATHKALLLLGFLAQLPLIVLTFGLL